jgi:hypothetical protein
MKLHSESSMPSGVRSVLTIVSSGMTDAQWETRRCYNCGGISHLRKIFPKPPNERYSGGRGQSGRRDRGCGGRRGGEQGDYRTNWMVEKGEEDSISSVVFA